MPLARANLGAAVESRGGPPTARAGFATDSDARPIPSGAGRRAGRSGGGSEWVSAQGALRPGSPGTNLSTGCSEFRPQPAATGGPIPGSSQLRAGTHRSARTGEEARHPLLMEWAGAESHLVCTPLLLAQGWEEERGAHQITVFLAGQKKNRYRYRPVRWRYSWGPPPFAG